MRIPFYQVDAFASEVFRGNSAAVCMLGEQWLSEVLMQSIAAENNLSETAFVVEDRQGLSIRWFTPTVEVDLCGHATLAAAHILYSEYHASSVCFNSKSGALSVAKTANGYQLDFPVVDQIIIDDLDDMITRFEAALGIKPLHVYAATDYLVVLASQADVAACQPNLAALAALGRRGTIITSTGEECDFVSRFFAPQSGINEDPVTGSAHCQLTPYWVKALGKSTLSAQQLSTRGGHLTCTLAKDRVLIQGQGVTVIKGEFIV